VTCLNVLHELKIENKHKWLIVLCYFVTCVHGGFIHWKKTIQSDSIRDFCAILDTLTKTADINTHMQQNLGHHPGPN